MQNSRTFTLAVANQWYNLWTLISSAPGWDPTFTTMPYVHSLVRILKYQNVNVITNPNNAGSVLSISLDGSNQSGEDLLSGGADQIIAQLDLKNVWFRFSLPSGQFNVAFIN